MSKYLYYYLLASPEYKAEIKLLTQGANINNISNTINSIKIPLPPLEAQQQIIDELVDGAETEATVGVGEKRDVAILFCDIRSFSINSEMMTAKENFAFVNVIYGKMGPIIRENNGFVDKYIGDAVMALF